MDQKILFGGTIGYGDSYLEFLFGDFEVFRLLALLHDAAGAVRAHSGKWLDYCYIIWRGPSLVCFFILLPYVKLFLLSFFNSVDFWSSKSCLVLNIEFADINFIKDLGVIFDGKAQGKLTSPFKTYKRTKQAFGCTKNLHGNVGKTVSFPYSLPRDVNGDF